MEKGHWNDPLSVPPMLHVHGLAQCDHVNGVWSLMDNIVFVIVTFESDLVQHMLPIGLYENHFAFFGLSNHIVMEHIS